MAGLEEGSQAPTFTLPAAGGKSVSLRDYRGRILVLYFYPRADTPGCTLEAADFVRLKSRFEKAGAAILGVSADPLRAVERFAGKHGLTVDLATDTELVMLNAYDAWGEKKMYGRTFQGVFRKTYVIDRAGRIVRLWPKVTVPGHAEDVLAFVEAL